ncbi:hypothetical protein BGZ76_002578 [Entomortierella beljakovae]|nr:hypothetical protein BGZ76_002578 [Entomortierella beljakovae]
MSSNPKEETGAISQLRQTLRPLFLYIVSTAQFLDIANGASVGVAILPIAKDLNFTPAAMPWILNAYTIAFAGLLLPSGRLGDLFGHRRMFMLGLLWFSTWSLIASFTRSPILFVVSRALQGAGAASTVPTAMALLAINFPAGPERTRAFSVFAAFGGFGAVIGMLLAGLLVSSIGWQWIFRVTSIAGFLLLLLGSVSIPLTPNNNEKPKIDYLGAISVSLGVTGIIYYISAGIEDGWASPKTLPLLFVGFLLLVAFVFIESKVAFPLMPLHIWKNKIFSISVVLAFVQMASFAGMIYYANMVFQEVYGWDTLKAALGFMVHAILAVVVFTIVGRVLPRLRLKYTILTGFILRGASALMFSFVTANTPYWNIIFPALIIHITGVGLTHLPIQISAVREIENKDQGLVGAIYNTGLQFGAPFGLGILNVVALSTNRDNKVEHGPELMTGYRHVFFGIFALELLAFVLSLGLLPNDKHSGHGLPAEKTDVADLESGKSTEDNSTLN